MIFENAFFKVLVFSKKYSSFFLELQSLGCAFACFVCFGTIIFETVFLARLGRSQKYSSFFSGTIIFEAVFFLGLGALPKI